MKHHIIILFFSGFLFSNCTKENKTIDTNSFNGYWEIDHVITSSGTEKTYGFNEFIDFFKTQDSLGFRSKVKPQFGGKYISNNQKITYRIRTKNDSTFLTYTNSNDTWNDLIIEATSKQICLKNKQGNLYYYKPYTPIIIDEKK